MLDVAPSPSHVKTFWSDLSRRRESPGNFAPLRGGKESERNSGQTFYGGHFLLLSLPLSNEASLLLFYFSLSPSYVSHNFPSDVGGQIGLINRYLISRVPAWPPALGVGEKSRIDLKIVFVGLASFFIFTQLFFFALNLAGIKSSAQKFCYKELQKNILPSSFWLWIEIKLQ